MRSVPRSIVITYSIGSLGTGMFLAVPSVLLLFYLTEVVAVAPLLAGLAVFLPRIWDVVTDPAMGWISDRTRSRLGRRRPWLLACAILTGISLVLLFNAPTWAQGTAGFFYVLLIYVISATAYTLFAVPYLSMPAEKRISLASHRRNQRVAQRSGVGHRRAGDASEEYRGEDVDVAQRSAKVSHQCLGEIDQCGGDAAAVHQLTEQDEQRHGHQCEYIKLTEDAPG